MIIRQISIFLENKPGQLAGICRALAKAEVNIATLSLADSADFGIVRMIVDDHVKGARVLTEAGFAVRETEVVTVTVPAPPGRVVSLPPRSMFAPKPSGCETMDHTTSGLTDVPTVE